LDVPSRSTDEISEKNGIENRRPEQVVSDENNRARAITPPHYRISLQRSEEWKKTVVDEPLRG
jgi:hypothetical protein